MDKSEKIRILQDMIKINTANGNEAELAKYIQHLLKIHDIDSQLISHGDNLDRANIVAEIGPKSSNKVLVLAGHLDTVDAGNLENWGRNPWSGELEDEIVYGRGAADMKSGLAGMVITLIELSKTQLTNRIRFIGTAGEELGAAGSKELTTQGYVHDVSAMIIGEPTGGDIVFAHSGSIDYTVHSQGKGAHSSMPKLGINAITNLVKFITAEEHAFDDAPENPVLGLLVHSVTVINGGNQVNSIPESAYLEGNIRPVPECNEADSIARLQAIITELNQQPDVNLSLTVNFSFTPVVNDQHSDFVQAIQTAHSMAFGSPAILKVIHGATDASEYIKDDHKFPMLVLGAGQWEDAHSLNESVTLDNYFKVMETYRQVALNWQNN